MSMLPEPGPADGLDPQAGVPNIFPTRASEGVSYDVPGLDRQARVALGRRLQRLVADADRQNARRRANALEYRRAAAMEPDSGGGQLEDWQAQVRAPLTRMACQNHTVRLNSLLDAKPPFEARARKPEYIDLLPEITDFLDAKLEEANWKRAARQVHRELPIVSPCAVRVEWETRKVWCPRIQSEFHEDRFTALIEAGADMAEAYPAAFDVGRDGLAKRSVEFEEQVIHDGPKLTVVPFEDLILLPATARSRHDVWAIGERVRLRGLDLRAGAEEGVYDEQAVADLLRGRSDALTDHRRDRLEIAAIEPDGSGEADEDPNYREYECAQLALYDDLDNNGRMEWYLVAVALETGTLIRAQYSPYEHGRAPYVLFAYSLDDLYGESTAELIAIIQEAASVCLNQIHDLTAYLAGARGSFVYDETCGIDFDTVRMGPGVGIRCENINGFREIPVAQGVPAAINALQVVYQLYKDAVELLTASSNPALGRETDNQRTLGEVQLVLGQAMQVFGDIVSGVSACWAEVFDLVRWTVAQYSETDEAGHVQYRVTAAPRQFQMPSGALLPEVEGTGTPQQPQFKSSPADILRAEIDLVPAGQGLYADAQTRLQQAMLVLNELKMNPITQSNLQVQAYALEQFLQATGYQGRDRVMQLIEQGLQQQQAMQAMAGLVQQIAGMEPGGANPMAGDKKAQGRNPANLSGQTATAGRAQAMANPHAGEFAKANGGLNG